MRLGLVLALTAIVAAGVVSPAFSKEPTRDPIARLEALVAAQPEEPGLSWALARAYADAGRAAEAADAFAGFRARWPDRQPTASRRQGRALVEAGRAEEAVSVLEEAVAAHPDDAAAHLYLGLAWLRTGDGARAASAFERSVELAPELAATVDLLRGTAALNQGDRRRGEALLDELASGDAGAVETRLASVLLRRRRSVDGPVSRFRLQLDGGVEHDSNVTLDSGIALNGIPTEQRDWRFQFGGSLGVDVWRSERARIHLGYRYDQTEHEDLEAFDLQSHQVYGSAQLSLHERLWLRLDGRGSWTKLDHEPYVDSWAVAPGLWFELGPRAGALRLFGSLERDAFDRNALLPSLERDGYRYGGGLEHVIATPWRSGGWLATAFRYRRTDTDGGKDVLGLRSAFDANRFELRMRTSIPLFWRTRFEASAMAAAERFDHRNVIDRLTDDGIGDPTPTRRNDWIYEFRTAIVRPIGRFVDVELAWRSTHRVSNVDVYAYERQIAGVYVTIHTP
ncbi:MAG: tetratricopeptide repeat protein [Myxococcota bacterium]|nr:tetratricopeptide repeat protein [Myxococcota bacterium]